MNKVNSYKNRIFLLTGFMASGKSFIGRKVADGLNCDFIDLDEQIEVQESSSIAEIFEEKGEEYFRILETKIFSNIISSRETLCIIAAGGGFPLKEENQILMKKVSVIFLDTDLDSILSRLSREEKGKRPLIATLDREEIKKLYKERYKIYINTADFVAKNYTEVIECINKVAF